MLHWEKKRVGKGRIPTRMLKFVKMDASRATCQVILALVKKPFSSLLMLAQWNATIWFCNTSQSLLRQDTNSSCISGVEGGFFCYRSALYPKGAEGHSRQCKDFYSLNSGMTYCLASSWSGSAPSWVLLLKTQELDNSDIIRAEVFQVKLQMTLTANHLALSLLQSFQAQATSVDQSRTILILPDTRSTSWITLAKIFMIEPNSVFSAVDPIRRVD